MPATRRSNARSPVPATLTSFTGVGAAWETWVVSEVLTAACDAPTTSTAQVTVSATATPLIARNPPAASASSRRPAMVAEAVGRARISRAPRRTK